MAAELMGSRVRFGVLVAILLWLGGIAGMRYWGPERRLRAAVDTLREELRARGMRQELAEFSEFAREDEASRRGGRMLTLGEELRRSPGVRDLPWMSVVGKGAARVGWKERPLADEVPAWEQVARCVESRRGVLDEIARLAREGPIRFRIVAERPPLDTGFLVRWEAALLGLADGVSLALRNGDREAAWRWLEALGILVNRRVQEPVGAVQLMQYRWIERGMRVTWEAIQADGWTDAELARLQAIWGAGSSRSNLSAVVALERAERMDACRWSRRETVVSVASIAGEVASELGSVWTDPGRVWRSIQDEWGGWRRAVHYQRVGSYQEELLVGRFLRDHEIDVREALGAASWTVARSLPAAKVSPILAVPLERHESWETVSDIAHCDFRWDPGDSLLGRDFAAEAWRRVVVAALGVERHRRRQHEWPATLADVDPGLLAGPALDPIDGEILRFRRTSPDGFVVYSLGVDGADDGGNPEVAAGRRPGSRRAPDLAWTRVATLEELVVWAAERSRRGPSRAFVRTVATPVPEEAAGPPGFLRRLGLFQERPPVTPANAPAGGGVAPDARGEGVGGLTSPKP